MLTDRFIVSIRTNFVGILFILMSAFTLSIGQFFWKLSAGYHPGLLILGFILYAIGAVFMVMAYRHGSLSVVHPMMSLGYVLAFFVGWLFLKENVNLAMISGLTLILIGNMLIGGGDH